jgi:hypothetical protein
MGKRKVTILDIASDAVAEVAYFVEGKGMPQTARNLLTRHLNFSIV